MDMENNEIEYESIRNEIVAMEEIQRNLWMSMYAAYVVIFALGIEFTHYLFLTTYIIVIPFQAQIHRYSWSIVKMATYIKVFYEENENNKLYWESFQISDVYTEYYNKFNKNIISRISRTGALQLSALSTILYITCTLYYSFDNGKFMVVWYDMILILIAIIALVISFILNKEYGRDFRSELEKIIQEYKKIKIIEKIDEYKMRKGCWRSCG